MKRLTREESKLRTRDALVAAAGDTFGREGFRSASVNEIAASAGVTTGALYASFKDKTDLFLAAYEHYLEERFSEIADIVAGTDSREEATKAGAEQWFTRSKRKQGWHSAWLEFRLYAARDREVNRRVITRHRAMLDRIASFYEPTLAEAGTDDPAGWAKKLARAQVAISNGYSIEQWTDPELREEEFVKASEAVMNGIWEQALATASKEPPA